MEENNQLRAANENNTQAEKEYTTLVQERDSLVKQKEDLLNQLKKCVFVQAFVFGGGGGFTSY